jgi:hypothetical protein
MPFMDAKPMSVRHSNFSEVEEWRLHRDHLQVRDSMV